MNMQGLLKQAQKMQKELAKVESELNSTIYEETMGGGVIKVEVKGSMEVESISIDTSLLNEEGKEDLEEMIKSAINEAACGQNLKISGKKQKKIKIKE